MTGGLAHTAIAYTISPTVVLFVEVNLQFNQLLMTDSLSTWEPPQAPTPVPLGQAADNLILHHTSAEILTIAEHAHDPVAPSATFVNAVEVPTQDSSAPTPFGSYLRSLEYRGPHSPLQPLILECELSNHPDRAFVELLLSDIRQGCDIGYTGPQFAHTARNLQSAFAHPSILDDALANECANNRILGPFDSPPLPNLRCSGLGLVPKHDGGWRTIYHLSAPPGHSINDFIDPSTYTLTYCTVDNAYAIVNHLGPGTLLSKIDLKNAFRLIPVRPTDWNLLGIFWQRKYYIDTCLPFGLRSAPCIFDRLATAIHWILQNNYNVNFLLHYLDDFLTAGPPDSSVCSQNLESMLTLCYRINAPVKVEKVIPPTTQITFLGIVIDTIAMTASISQERKLRSYTTRTTVIYTLQKVHQTSATFPHWETVFCL